MRLFRTYHTLDSGGELNHFFGLDVTEAMDTSNTVSDSEDLKNV